MNINNKNIIRRCFELLSEGGVHQDCSKSYVASIFIFIKYMQDVYNCPENYPNLYEAKDKCNEMYGIESVNEKWTKKFDSVYTILWNKLKKLSPELMEKNLCNTVLHDWIGNREYYGIRKLIFPKIRLDILPLLFMEIDSIKISNGEDLSKLYEIVCNSINWKCPERYHHFFYRIFGDMKFLFSYTCHDEGLVDEYGAKYSSDGMYLIKVPNIKEYKVKKGTLYICDYCFYDDGEIEKVTLPESIKAIGECSFYLCHKLKELTIGENVDYIGGGAFNSCYELDLTINSPLFKLINNMLISSDGKILFSYWGMDENVKIPEGVTILYKNSLRNANYTNSIELPNTLESIQSNSLFGYKGEFLCLPPMVQFVGCMAFGFSKRLKSLNIPENCYVHPDAFHKCYKLTTIYLSGRNITLDAALLYYCKQLTTIYVLENDELYYKSLLDPALSRYIKIFRM